MFFIKEIIKETNRYVVHFKTGESEIKIVEFSPEEFKKMHNLMKQAILKGNVKASTQENVDSSLDAFKEELKKDMEVKINDVNNNYKLLNNDVKNFIDLQSGLSQTKKGFEIQLENLVKKIDNLKILEETAVKKLTTGEKKRDQETRKALEQAETKNREVQDLIKSVNSQMSQLNTLVASIKTAKSENDAHLQELSKNIKAQGKANADQMNSLLNGLKTSNKVQLDSALKKINEEKSKIITNEKVSKVKAKEPEKPEPIKEPPKKEQKKIIEIPERKEEPKKADNPLIDRLKKGKIVIKKK